MDVDNIHTHTSARSLTPNTPNKSRPPTVQPLHLPLLMRLNIYRQNPGCIVCSHSVNKKIPYYDEKFMLEKVYSNSYEQIKQQTVTYNNIMIPL